MSYPKHTMLWVFCVELLVNYTHQKSKESFTYPLLCRSQLVYCSIIRRPHLIKDIKMIEQLQQRATKFILNDYESDYFDWLVKLNLVPIMYSFEYLNIKFAIISLKSLNTNFDISNYISSNYGSTRSSAKGKLKHIMVPNNKLRHFYFSRLPCLWNFLPPVDLSLSVSPK